MTASIRQGILPQLLGLHNGRIGLGQGICLALNDHSHDVVDAGVKRNWSNLSQLRINTLVGFAVADFCEQNAGKLGN